MSDVEGTFFATNASHANHIHGRLGRWEDYRNYELDHNQGIGRLNNPDGRYLVLARSMKSSGIFGAVFGRRTMGGQLLIFKLGGYENTPGELGGSGASHSLLNEVVWEYNDIFDRDHPDGLSVWGSYFVHGISCSGRCPPSQHIPRIYVWDATYPNAPMLSLDFNLVTWLGDVASSTASAGAATMVQSREGKYLIIFKSNQISRVSLHSLGWIEVSHRVLRFIEGTSLTDESTWSQIDVLPESEIEAWDDGSFNYQHISAVKECGKDTIYLVATKGDTYGPCDSDDSEVARLYRVDRSGDEFSLTMIGHKYFKCMDGVAFGGAAGLYISPTGKLNFYTSEKKFHMAGSGIKVKFREFWTD